MEKRKQMEKEIETKTISVDTLSLTDFSIWSGRGAFCGPVKVRREPCWRGQKRVCRHK
jgi:hypothetical protein